MKKQPKQARSRETVEIMLEACTRILRREGEERLTTNRVAEVAGVSVGSLYQYFPNKQSLLAELSGRYDAQFLERVAQAFEEFGGMSLREKLRALTRFTVEIHREDTELHNALASEIPEGQHEIIFEFVRGVLEEHRDELRKPDLTLTAYIVVQLGENMVHNTAVREPERLEDPHFADELCDLLERYLLR